MSNQHHSKHAADTRNGAASPKAVLAILVLAIIGFVMFNSCQDPTSSWNLSDATGGFFSPILHVAHNAAMSLFGWTGDPNITVYGNFVRKVAHFLEYAALGCACAALAIAIKGKALNSLLWMAVFVPLATAVADEFVQSFMGRTSLVNDVVLDFVGAFLGVVIVVLLGCLLVKGGRHTKRP